MKIVLHDRVWGLEICMTPESVEDTAKLLRFANNAKSVRPDVYLTFNSDVECYVSLKKLHSDKQVNSINPFRKKK